MFKYSNIVTKEKVGKSRHFNITNGGFMSHKIGIVTPSSQSHRTAEETLSLGYLGAVLRSNDYEVCVVDGWLESLSSEEIVDRLGSDGSPSVVGVSCYRSNIAQAVEVLIAIRKRFGQIPVICGGYGPTFHEQLFIENGFTAVVKGEAEHIIVPLVHALVSGRSIEGIPGISYLKDGQICNIARSEPVADLDHLPFPIRDTVEAAIEQGNFVHLCTSRGCEAHCSFCSIFSFAKGAPGQRRWRQRSVGNIVDEIRCLHETYGITHFKFVDDSFLEPPRDTSWAEKFQKEVSRHNLHIKFRTQVRADRLNSEIVKALKEAGWFSTSVGIENFSAKALKRMGKIASVDDNLAALELLTTHGIYTQMGMILFDPHTDISELSDNLSLWKTHRWPITKGVFTEMYAAEGTVFAAKLVRRGLLQNDPIMQNHSYQIIDPQARRVYLMLKGWHRSHSTVYDWVIDSLTAPKVLIGGDHEKVYQLYRVLQSLDLEFFERALNHVIATKENVDDLAIVRAAVDESVRTYKTVESNIAEIYSRNRLSYNAVPNPFLGSA